MKPSFKFQFRQSKVPSLKSPVATVSLAVAIVVSFSHSAKAADITWNNAPAVGDFNVAANWTGGVLPGSADVAKINNTGAALGGTTVNFLAGDNFTVTTLDLAAAIATDNRPVFNQTGGTLNAGTLQLGHTGYGATVSPEYHLSSGILNVTTAWSFGNGSAIKFLATGGTFNYSGSAIILGSNGVTQELTLSNGAILNYNTANQITFGGGGNAAGIGKVSLSNTSSFNASTVTTILMGNDATNGNLLTLADSASFNAPLATIALGQWNNGSATVPAIAGGTITLSGTSTLKAGTIKTGGNNSGNPQWGVVNLNGGTIETRSIQSGASLTPADATHNVVNANGGTLKATVDIANFFPGVFVNLQAGGLKFDTNNFFVTVTNALSGAGGLNKKGQGTLTLSSNSLTYQGDTVVTEGTLSLASGTLSDTANVRIAGGDVAKLSLGHGLEDAIGTLTLGGTLKPNGVYGSSSSAAPLANQDDTYFEGTGTVRVGPVTATPHNLVWEGALGQSWSTSEYDTNFLDGATQVAFKTFDHVTFNDVTTPPDETDRRTIFVSGIVQPSSVTFNNSVGFDYTLVSSDGIGGTTGIVKNGGGTVSLGGGNSSFTGPIAVNAGKLVQGDNKSFGLSSGITIASGAAVDLNGRTPGSIYTYTLGGPGPLGTAAVINSGAVANENAGIKNLILNADSVVGNDGSRFDLCFNGTLTGNSHTLTKVGNNFMSFRGDAGGTPVTIIAAGGRIWAENNDSAFGGATGSLIVKAGVYAGTYGVRTIATPVTVEGGGFHNQGNGKGTWTGALTLSGNVTIEGGGVVGVDEIAISGTISGTANVTKQGTAAVTITHPTYVGDTTVATGQLTLLNAELSNTGKVSIATAGTLNLPHGLEDTVGTLFLDGVQVAAGTYGATGNLSAQFTTNRIVGAGKLNVTTGPATANAFSAWADANITNPAYAAQKGLLDDPDKDGFNNNTEFLFGTNPETNTGSLTSLTQSGNTLVLLWNQRKTGAAYRLQESATLVENPWPVSTVVPVAAGDQSGVGVDYIRIQATIPINTTRKFVRVDGAQN